MNQKRIRINLEDSDGTKFKFDIEGNVTRDKVLKLFELMDLMNIEEDQAPNLDSVGGKIWYIIENSFPSVYAQSCFVRQISPNRSKPHLV